MGQGMSSKEAAPPPTPAPVAAGFPDMEQQLRQWVPFLTLAVKTGDVTAIDGEIAALLAKDFPEAKSAEDQLEKIYTKIAEYISKVSTMKRGELTDVQVMVFHDFGRLMARVRRFGEHGMKTVTRGYAAVYDVLNAHDMHALHGVVTVNEAYVAALVNAGIETLNYYTAMDVQQKVKAINNVWLCLDAMVRIDINMMMPYARTLFKISQDLLTRAVALLRAAEEPEDQFQNAAHPCIEFWSSFSENTATPSHGARAGEESKLLPQYQEEAHQILSELSSQMCDCTMAYHVFDDEDSCKVAAAASICVGLIGEAVGETMLAPISQFVDVNMCDADWRKRTAAVSVFGAGRWTGARWKEFVERNLKQLLDKVCDDTNEYVRMAAACGLAALVRVRAELVKEVLGVGLVEKLCDCLADKAKVASDVAYAMNSIGASEPFLVDMPRELRRRCMTELRATARRANGPDYDMCVRASSALGSWIQHLNTDLPLLDSVLDELLLDCKEFAPTFIKRPSPISLRDQCGRLIHKEKLSFRGKNIPWDLKEYLIALRNRSDTRMNDLTMALMNAGTAVGTYQPGEFNVHRIGVSLELLDICVALLEDVHADRATYDSDTAEVLEEALILFINIIVSLKDTESGFHKRLGSVSTSILSIMRKPKMGLQVIEQCYVAIGEVYRNVDPSLLGEWSGAMVPSLVEMLGKEDPPETLFTTIGDMTMSTPDVIFDSMDRIVPPYVAVLQKHIKKGKVINKCSCGEHPNTAEFAWLNLLEGISSIFNGLVDRQLDVLEPLGLAAIDFALFVEQYREKGSVELQRNACGVIGDVANVLPTDDVIGRITGDVRLLVEKCLVSRDATVVEAARFTEERLQELGAW